MELSWDLIIVSIMKADVEFVRSSVENSGSIEV